MRQISVHVEGEVYRSLKILSERTGRSVSELAREAMAEYIDRKVSLRSSFLDLPAHPSGGLLKPWIRDELLNEMLDPAPDGSPS